MNNMYQKYKPSKSILEQINYLNEKKKVQFNDMSKEIAGENLLRYNYINVITPFKHYFAKKNEKHEVIKQEGRHIYTRNVEFSEYYELFVRERSLYPTIINNILEFEIHFKSILAYIVLTEIDLSSSDKLINFLDYLKLSFATLNFSKKRINHMNNHLDSLKTDVFKYADVYCFFDRMSLGNILTIFICLNEKYQKSIFNILKQYKQNLNVVSISQFIDRVFCIVSIRNCVMHSNSLEVLVRFFDPKTKEIRTQNDRRKYLNIIKFLSKEKTHD